MKENPCSTRYVPPPGTNYADSRYQLPQIDSQIRQICCSCGHPGVRARHRSRKPHSYLSTLRPRLKSLLTIAAGRVLSNLALGIVMAVGSTWISDLITRSGSDPPQARAEHRCALPPCSIPCPIPASLFPWPLAPLPPILASRRYSSSAPFSPHAASST